MNEDTREPLGCAGHSDRDVKGERTLADSQRGRDTRSRDPHRARREDLHANGHGVGLVRWKVEAKDVSPRYYEDIVGRYHGRPASRQETLDAQAGYPSDDLVAPLGILLLARQGANVLGCAGMQVSPGDIGEVTRVFVEPAARGKGVGRRLMEELERRSRVLGLDALRLDTRTDLVEARRLYASLGFIEGKRTIRPPTRTTGSVKNWREGGFSSPAKDLAG